MSRRERPTDFPCAMIDRLRLTDRVIDADGGRDRRGGGAPGSPRGDRGASTRPNGLLGRPMRIPLGVIAIIYESRPNVHADAAALVRQAGNAVILRGGRGDPSNVRSPGSFGKRSPWADCRRTRFPRP